jgi:hypothetical protein
MPDTMQYLPKLLPISTQKLQPKPTWNLVFQHYRIVEHRLILFFMVNFYFNTSAEAFTLYLYYY